MQVASLQPSASVRMQFLWSDNKWVPAEPGCYVIAAYDMTVMYVGLATKSIRARMASHLDTEEKRKGALGKLPYWFFYLSIAASEVRAIERGWMNQSILADGVLPPLNRVHSPV